MGVNERTGEPFLKNANGDIATPGSDGVDSVDGLAEGDDGKLQLEMEAVTEEIWQQDRKQREQEKVRKQQERTGEIAPGLPMDGGSGATESTMDGEKADKPPEGKQQGIRIVLKAKGQEDYKLKVKPVRLAFFFSVLLPRNIATFLVPSPARTRKLTTTSHPARSSCVDDNIRTNRPRVSEPAQDPHERQRVPDV